MGCTGCSVGVANGTPKGCGSKGNCGTGGCNRMNTFDWLTQMDLKDVDGYYVAEVSFKNGARKSFFRFEPQQHVTTGDTVVVEASSGYDIGDITLSGELVRLQMKRKKFKESNLVHSVIRRANERDLERLQEAREQERQTLIRARAIARSIKLDMKIGDVEFQGDKRKATFYYTANGRVDFRELIRHFAREFRVKIEMRQIGARQESARIGGLGSCGRELCCSTWLTDFKSVSTAAARYQNLAINQAKLSGQCGRLKCCLNYELDTYMEAVKAFPKRADKIQTEAGTATLVKTDIFKQLMFYAYVEGRERGQLYALDVERVKEIQKMNRNGEKPLDLRTMATLSHQLEEDNEPDYDSELTGVIELPPEERRRKKRKKRKKSGDKKQGGETKKQRDGQAKKQETGDTKSGDEKKRSDRNRSRRNRGRNRSNSAKAKAENTGQTATPKQEQGSQKPEAKTNDDNKTGGNSRSRNRRRGRGRNRNKNQGGEGQNNSGNANNNNNKNDGGNNKRTNNDSKQEEW